MSGLLLKVSALILTHNEERNIARCLDSLVGVDDIVVVDSQSTDSTRILAKERGARIFTRCFDNFANQRNFGLDEGGLRNEWVLHLDADEATTPEFLDALHILEPNPGVDGYRVPSKTLMNGQWLRYSGMYPTYQVRLGHRDRLRFKQVGHGQQEDLPSERVGTFFEPYLHHNFSHGVEHWLLKHVTYAEAEAEELFKQRAGPAQFGQLFVRNETDRRRALKRFVSHLPIALRPALRFIYTYFLRRGFLDGRAGLQYAVMLSCYEAMIVSLVLDKSDAEK